MKHNFLISIAVLFSLTSLNAESKYTMDQIYNKMCIECHSADGSGNTDKLTPSIKNNSLKEIYSSLIDIENENGHIIMEHNREKILEMDMKYSAQEMSQYMFKRFNK